MAAVITLTRIYGEINAPDDRSVSIDPARIAVTEPMTRAEAISLSSSFGCTISRDDHLKTASRVRVADCGVELSYFVEESKAEIEAMIDPKISVTTSLIESQT
ncbi:MAG: hypothetical protein ACR2QF_02555 [Geminicoccaceae bacterium]